ncbi:Colicin I receptor precursor [Marinomonas aquimarina]|uniref:Colicin I receptor n=1 Tax=Marinomonas aquimarina TaxID=295068 RepID=A0A1A8TRG3_9GAMM|nr:TonB-dependent receptor [Marinomonas aquimarina]SBS35498.1 Colicin I receptor precursor [Marinomonas aquimarina]
MRLRPLAASISLIVASGYTMANDIALPTITVESAAGVEQKLTDAPASVSVITKEDLDKKPYMTLLDAVSDIEGVDVGETRDKTGQGGVSIRGMGADYTLILIDGRRQNNIGDLYPNNFGGNQFNHIPPKEMVERIEIIRGPASTLYGADAMGGVINIITKKVGSEWAGSVTHSRTFESNADYGNDDTTEFAFSGPIIEDKLGLGIRGSLYNRDGSNPQYAADYDPNGVEHNRSLGYGRGGRTVDNENTNLGLRLDYLIDERQTVTFDYETSNQEYDNTPQDGNNPLGTTDSVDRLPRSGYALDQEFVRDQFSIRHEGKWGFGNSDITLHHIETSNNGRTLPLTGDEKLLYDQMIADNGGVKDGIEDQLESTFLPRPQRVMETRQTTLDAKFDSLVGDHLLVYGGQIMESEMEDGVFGMDSSGGQQAGKVQPHNQWSLFAEDNWDITEDVTLTGGLRYDDHEVFGGNVSPRAYANWRVNPAWTIKGGVSTGYKAPKASDLFPGITGFGGQGTRPFVGSPELQPETSVNTEIAAYFEHPEGHNFNATIFSNQFKDKIARGDGLDCAAQTGELAYVCDTWGATSLSQKTNIDRVDIKGIELAGRYRFNEAWSLRANYTYTDSEQKSGSNAGKPLNDTAKHMANATLDWQVNEQFNTYLTAEMRSKRYRGSPGRGWDSNVEYPEYYKAYTIFHLGAAYELNDTFTFNARVNNLLDEDFTSYQTVYTTEDGGATWESNYIDDYNLKAKARNVWLSVTAKF